MRKDVSSQREVIHAHLLAREVPMNVQKFDNVRKDITYPGMYPRLHLRFSGDHVLHLVLYVHRTHLLIIRAPWASTRD